MRLGNLLFPIPEVKKKIRLAVVAKVHSKQRAEL